MRAVKKQKKRKRPARDRVPLCVDLDGTLIRTDLLVESFFAALKCSALSLLAAPWWLVRGKAFLKRRLAACADLDCSLLPYHQEFLEYLKSQRARGRSLVLVTASDQKYAQQVAAHLGLFDTVLASDGSLNLSGVKKREYLSARFGHKGFDYAGNGRADLSVFPSARQALLVEPSRGVRAAAARLTDIGKVFERRPEPLLTWLRALRLHQWLKNLLVFVPVVAAHQLNDPTLVSQALLAFLAFGFCASSMYLLNDLLDLPSDRAHPRKRRRPFAAGRLPITSAIWLIPLLLAAAFAIAVALPWKFAAVLAGYLVLTITYTLWLKQKLFVDVIILAGLYTMRILAGSAATEIVPTFWLLAFSMFVFLSLALLKRYAELLDLRDRHGESAVGRGYEEVDLATVQSFGAASGYLSVLVLALYINSDDVRVHYSRPEVIWLLCLLLLYWISRMWQRAGRGVMHDDPIVYALNDNISRWLVLVGGIILLLAA